MSITSAPSEVPILEGDKPVSPGKFRINCSRKNVIRFVIPSVIAIVVITTLSSDTRLLKDAHGHVKEADKDIMGGLQTFENHNHEGYKTMSRFPYLSNIKNVTDLPVNPNEDIGFFWTIPKSGTSTIKALLSRCFHLRMASSTQLIDYPDNPKKIELIDLGSPGRFVNVNFGYMPGLLKAKMLNMAQSGLVDAAATSYLHQGAQVFTPQNSARLFTIIRHPVERMNSDFYYSQFDTWEATYNETNAKITFEEYASDGRYHVDNWMTRMIAGVHHGPVKDQDLMFAKEFLREKCLVLFLDTIDESVDRLQTYMNWNSDPAMVNPQTGKNGCMQAFMHETPANANNHPPITPNTPRWDMLRRINEFDINLYWYAKELFNFEQKDMIEFIKNGRQKQANL